MSPVPSEVEERFFAGIRNDQVHFAINDAVDITMGRYVGRGGSVISILALDPEPLFLIELGDAPFGDIELPQSSLKLANG